MGRSVDYLNDAEYVGYINFDSAFSEDNWEWEEFLDWIERELIAKYPSLCSENKWEGNEVNIILENYSARVGVSSYYGLVSVSIAPIEDYEGRTALGERWIRQISSGVDKILSECPWGDSLRKVGRFGNGNCVFEKAI